MTESFTAPVQPGTNGASRPAVPTAKRLVQKFPDPSEMFSPTDVPTEQSPQTWYTCHDFPDAADNTKLVTFELVGATTAKTMTFTISHTDNRTLTFPDATDTLVGKATTDTLTNKTLTAPTITAPAITGWTTSPVGEGIAQWVSVSITNAEMLALRAVPKTLVAAPAVVRRMLRRCGSSTPGRSSASRP